MSRPSDQPAPERARYRTRRQVEGLLRRVDFPQGSFDTMQGFMQVWLGREIRIEHRDATQSAICGLWVGMKDLRVDVIFVDLDSPHWRQTIAHEWGHMLCGHATAAGTAELLRSLAPLLPDSAIEFALSRDVLTTPQEQEAEAVGDAISLRLLAAESRRARSTSIGGLGRVL